jgi:UDPglucose--hexose-1-phosphate uridylyltransferase
MKIHRRYNPLINEWVLVSPHRAKRPWQGQNEKSHFRFCRNMILRVLCQVICVPMGSKSAKTHLFFENDFAKTRRNCFWRERNRAFKSSTGRGISRVVCFHQNTLTKCRLKRLNCSYLAKEYTDWVMLITLITFFENKGSVMGCSNPSSWTNMGTIIFANWSEKRKII